MKSIARYSVALLIAVMLVMVGCGSDDKQQDTPKPAGDAASAQEAVKQMLAYAQKGDWVSLISEYYAQDASVDSVEQAEALLKRFETNLGRQLIPQLQRAAALTPEVAEGKALFKQGGQTVYTLYLDEQSNEWRFKVQ